MIPGRQDIIEPVEDRKPHHMFVSRFYSAARTATNVIREMPSVLSRTWLHSGAYVLIVATLRAATHTAECICSSAVVVQQCYLGCTFLLANNVEGHNCHWLEK